MFNKREAGFSVLRLTTNTEGDLSGEYQLVQGKAIVDLK